MTTNVNKLICDNQMILLRSRVLRFFHFVKPTLSNIASRADLEAILQKRLLREVVDHNSQTLQQASFSTNAQSLLKLSPAAVKDLQHRTIPLSIIHPATKHHQVVQVKVGQPLSRTEVEGAELGLVGANTELHHFSQERGVANFQQLQEYEWDQCTLRIFNLPDNISSQDIQATLRASDAKITIKYCILGLPAYATAAFTSPEDLQAVLQKLPSRKIDFGERTAVVRGPEQAEKLKLGWRRMVIEIQQDSELGQTAVELSRYGRVLHLDWPTEASLNPSLTEIKEFYKDSTELVRINHINRDGSIHSEFYPPIDVWKVGEDDRDQGNIMDRAEKLKESYQNRTRFARNLNVYVGRQHELSLHNRGYCVVTYSAPEQCQSLYFRHGAQNKMQLVEDKLDFQWDPLFRKQLLRQIDNQYLLGKKISLKQEQQHQSQYINPTKQGLKGLQFHLQKFSTLNQRYQPNDDLKLLEKILNKLCFKELTQEKNPTSYYLGSHRGENNAFHKWDEHLKKYKNLKQKVDRKTFDQLAQLQLFGRVLPKDQNIERMIVEDTKLKKNRQDEIIRQNRLLTNYRYVMAKNKFYRRQQDRKNRLANLQHGLYRQEEVAEEAVAAAEETAEPAADDGENIGKAAFSTRRSPILYRKRTPEEQAVFQQRYQQFVRSTIYEYMGVFHDKDIEEAANLKHSVLNPRALRWRDGSSFLQEQDIPNALQFRRDLPAAQIEYEDYIYSNEFLRSTNIKPDQFNADRQSYAASAVQTLSEVGLVESVRKVAGDDLERKAAVLNAQSAQFGEEWRIEEKNGQKLLVKIRKLQNILPLHRVAHLEQFITNHAEQPTSTQAELFNKHYQAIRMGETFPDELSDAFGVRRGLRLDDLLAEVGADFKIYRKDLEMAERARTYTHTQLKQDIDEQIKIEKRRRHQRKIDSLAFSKDPSQIYAKDREGYYKVSRYRQI